VFFQPYPVVATNDVWGNLIATFNDTATRIGLYGAFEVPQNYNASGTTAVKIIWTATATSGDVEWDFDYRAITGDNSESLDQSGTQETVNNNDTAPGGAHRRLECSITLTAGNFAAGDLVTFGLFRDGTDAGDTMAAAAHLFDLVFSYTD
jgi:hypothetical protein